MILSIASSSPPPQLLILTWTTICHYCCRHVPSFCPWPRTWPIVPTRGKLSTPGLQLSTRLKLSTRGKLSKSVLRIIDDQITHVWQILPGSHPGFSSLGAWERDTVVTTRSCSQQCWLLQLFWRLIWISDFSVTTFPEWLDTKSPNLPHN